MPPELQKIPLKEKIASILMQRIIDGKIAVGDKLKEAHLAKEFGVSQAPVREAMITLVSKGILEHRPNVGTHVKSYSKEETIEIYQIREALELYACHCLENADISFIKEIYKKMLKTVKEQDVKRLVEYDQYFHELLLKGCGNCSMTHIWREQYTKSAVTHVIKEFDAPLEEIVSMHLPIIEAIEERSVQKCDAAIRHHYQAIIKNIKDKQ